MILVIIGWDARNTAAHARVVRFVRMAAQTINIRSARCFHCEGFDSVERQSGQRDQLPIMAGHMLYHHLILTDILGDDDDPREGGARCDCGYCAGTVRDAR
jgi:hypothetical protein